MKTILFFLFLVLSASSRGQSFPYIGQLPSTAFPVCGSTVFKQSVVPQGATHIITVPGCGGYADTNPYWYLFTCFQTGTLGFLITPNNIGDDYDWMLFDITGHTPDDVFTTPSLVVTGNWAGTYGLTGARNRGSTTIECASFPEDKHPTFSTMPVIKKDHKYLLLVSHYTETQSGYALSFGGGTAVITDPKEPHLVSVAVACDYKSLRVYLNKGMRCSSLIANGSDFRIAGFDGAITEARAANCKTGFDMDTVILRLNAQLTTGKYMLIAATGGDGNTLLDDCNNQVPVGENISFDVLPPHATPMDSLTPPDCAPDHLQLVFSDPIQCSSIAADGSDFQLTGNPEISISAASGVCTGGLTTTIRLTLNKPVRSQSDFRLTLVAGRDGNSLINECGFQSAVNQQIGFLVKDTVSAAFTYDVDYGCTVDTIRTQYSTPHSLTESLWTIDSTEHHNGLQPSFFETVFGIKNVQHIASNGFCSDTAYGVVNLDNILKAQFEAPREVCPKGVITLTNTSVGHIVASHWDFGDGETSNLENPPDHLFPYSLREKMYRVQLTVQDKLGCRDSTEFAVNRLQSCYITVPNAFTPNGDGKNDFLYPLNAFQTKDLEFRVFNRYGQLVFETRDFNKKWDGNIGGIPQGTGTYIWTLSYEDGLSGKKFFLRGSSLLIR